MRKTFPSFGSVLVKADPNDTLERHMVDVRKAFAESVRRQEVPVQYVFDSSVPNRSSVQKRPSVYNWKSRTSTWKKGATEKTNCRKMTYYHLAGGDRVCRPRSPREQVPRNSLREMRGVIQQGYLFSITSRSNPFTSTIPGANCLIK